MEVLNAAGVPCGPINTIDQTFADVQVEQLEMTKTVDHAALGPVSIIDHAVNMSRTPSQMRRATPELGEHTEEVLAEFGYGSAEVAALRDAGAI